MARSNTVQGCCMTAQGSVCLGDVAVLPSTWCQVDVQNSSTGGGGGGVKWSQRLAGRLIALNSRVKNAWKFPFPLYAIQEYGFLCLFNDSSSSAHVTWYGVEYENGCIVEVVRISKAVIVAYFVLVFHDCWHSCERFRSTRRSLSDWLRAGRSGVESRWGRDRPWGPPSLL